MQLIESTRPGDPPQRERVTTVRALGIDLTSAPSVLVRVVKLAACYRTRLVIATVASLIASLLGIAAPQLLGRAVDAAHSLLDPTVLSGDHSLRPLGIIAVLLLVVLAARGGSQMASGFNSETIGQDVGRDLRLAFFEKIQRLDFAFHDRVHSGDLITRGMLDLEGVRGFIEMGLQRSVQLLMLLGVGGIALLRTDPVMALCTLSFVPFVLWRTAGMGLRLRLAWTRLQEKMSVLTRVMEENLQGARVVRAFGAGDHELARFDTVGDEALQLSNTRFRVRARAMASINTAFYSAMLLTLWVGWRRVDSGAITIGQLAECLAFMTVLQMPVRQVSMVMNSAARAVSSGGRIFEMLDAQPEIADGPEPLVIGEGVLRFENVGFGYANADGQPAIGNIDFAIGRGQTLGIVGASGSGKSTIANLIPRFYDVTAGRITIDGQDIRGVTLESLRVAVGLIQQDVFLFDDSGKDNLAYAVPDSDFAAIAEAARVAEIHDHFDAQPHRFDTPVGERGANLSGGQRQRLSIARGLLPSPAILIFDDATSAVDAATEHRVRHTLRTANADRTTIIISHRLSSLSHADEIIVLVDGRIAERGNHATLIARDGHYAMLDRLQGTVRVPIGDGAVLLDERLSA